MSCPVCTVRIRLYPANFFFQKLKNPTKGDSSGDEKIDPEDLDEDEKLALRMQMGYEPNFEDIEEDDEKAKWGGLKIIFAVGLFIMLFYAFIFFLLKQTGKGNGLLKFYFRILLHR